jgi:UDP-glucose 4-epimerase
MILITGSNSLLGRSIAKRLVSMGEKVRCHDSFEPEKKLDGVEHVTGNILTPHELNGLFDNVKTLFHLKEKLRPGSHGRKLMRKTNIRGTENIISMAVGAEVENILMLSSYAVYGKKKALPITEESEREPVTAYGRDKLKAEELLKKYTENTSINTTIIRPAVVTGPGTSDPIILQTMYMAMGIGKENIVYISGTGDNRLQLLDIEDAAEAFILAYKSGQSGGKVYNAGSDDVPTEMEEAEKLRESLNLDYTIKHYSPLHLKILSLLLRPTGMKYFTGEHLMYLQKNIVLDCSKIKDDLGWVPQKNNIDILEDTAAWYSEEKKLGKIR